MYQQPFVCDKFVPKARGAIEVLDCLIYLGAVHVHLSICFSAHFFLYFSL